MNSKIKFLSYYLPQYHPIPENDEWWGKGFTEWTNVTKAAPLFKWHKQPILPGELGFYDLRVPKVQEQQAKLALDYGIDGFIYYQYWFGEGKMLLEKPAEAMLKNKNIKLPFCFCWANETWKGVWHGLHNPKVLIEQKYGGEEDYTAYFNYLLPFFKDDRYIKIDNKPMFRLYKTQEIPDVEVFIEVFIKNAKAHGFSGIHFIATGYANSKQVLENENIKGVVAVENFHKLKFIDYYKYSRFTLIKKIETKALQLLGFYDKVGYRKKPLVIDYKKGLKRLKVVIPNKKYIPCVVPNWDNSARSGMQSMIFKNTSPKLFYQNLKIHVKEFKKHKENPPFVVIKAWNEWAEGNYLEPDRKYGRKWLEAIKIIKDKYV